MKTGTARIPALDGVRGIAILAVLLVHFRDSLFQEGPIQGRIFALLQPGWAGVDLFFVLSGFLITGILLDTLGTAGYFCIFYLRRTLRIFPLYYFYLGFMFLIGDLYFRFWGVDLFPGDNPFWFILYLSNWRPWPSSLLSHLWSLAIEEQFYLLWPAVVYFCPKSRFPALCVILMLVGILTRAFLSWEHVNPLFIARNTFARIDGLAVGAFLAAAMRDPRLWKICGALKVPVLYVAPPAILAVWLKWGLDWENAVSVSLCEPLFVLLFGALVFHVLTKSDGWVVSVMNKPTLRFFGRYSYGIYMLHLWPHALLILKFRKVMAIQQATVAFTLEVLYIPAMIGVSVALALLLYRFIEAPFLRWKDRFVYGRNPALSYPYNIPHTYKCFSGAEMP